ncbi:hypothetical protein TYRP_011466, partial [Tyrophagus putrescentiae]
EHLLDGPLEVLLLKRLSGDRISEEEVLAAVEVLQSTDGITICDAEEVINLECDAGQLWPGGHHSADQGRLADGGGAAGQQLHVAGLHVEEAVELLSLLGLWVAPQIVVPDLLDALLAVRLVPEVVALEGGQLDRPVVLVQSQVGEVGKEGGEGGHLIGTGTGVEESALHQVQSGERRKADNRGGGEGRGGEHVGLIVPGDAKLLQADIDDGGGGGGGVGVVGGGGQRDDQLLDHLSEQ